MPNLVMDNYLSKKLRDLSSLLLIGVVAIHAITLTQIRTGEPEKFVEFIEHFCVDGLSRIAVPIFYAISGFLFFWNTENGLQYKKKLGSRTRSLLVPYLIWSGLIIGLYILFQEIEETSKIFNTPGTPLLQKRASEVIGIWLLNPLGFHLWFIRELYFLAVLSPLIFWILKSRICSLVLIVLATAWFFDLRFFIEIDEFKFLRSEAIVFFIVGSWISLNTARLYWVSAKFSNAHCVGNLVVWVLMCSYVAYVMVFARSADDKLFFIFAYKLSIIVGISAVWTSYDLFLPIFNRIPDWTMYQSFFVYLSHVPTVIAVKKAFAYFLPGAYGALVAFFLAVFITIVLCALIGLITFRAFPKFYFVLTGGRGPNSKSAQFIKLNSCPMRD